MEDDIKQLKNLTNTLKLKDSAGYQLKASGYKQRINLIIAAKNRYVSDKEKEILAPAQPKAPPKREPPKKQPHVQATNKKEPFKAPTFDEIMDNIGLFKGLIEKRGEASTWKPNWNNVEIDDELHVVDRMQIPVKTISAGHELQRIIQDVLLEPLMEMIDIKPLPYTQYYRVSDLDKLEVARKSMYRTVIRHLKQSTGTSGGPGDIKDGIDRIKYVQKNLQVAKRLLNLLRVPNDILNSGEPNMEKSVAKTLMQDQIKGMNRSQRKEFEKSFKLPRFVNLSDKDLTKYVTAADSLDLDMEKRKWKHIFDSIESPGWNMSEEMKVDKLGQRVQTQTVHASFEQQAEEKVEDDPKKEIWVIKAAEEDYNKASQELKEIESEINRVGLLLETAPFDEQGPHRANLYKLKETLRKKKT